jgi:cytochrome c oxidase subunit IV
MMEVEVNWLAIVLAAASTMVVGSVWYAKSALGGTWMKLTGLTEAKMRKGGAQPIMITVVVSLMTAFVLAHLTYLSNYFYQNSFLEAALLTAFWVWAGFVAARFITHDVFEQRPSKLTALNVSHELVTLLVMALIIGLIQP